MQDKQSKIQNPKSKIPRPAFTLTELLIVIAIIAVLAGLIAAAAVNALRAANRGRISLEIKQISASIEEFKNELGAYPPNAMNPEPTVTTPGYPSALVRSDFIRIFKKAFPRHKEHQDVIAALAGIRPPTTLNLVGGQPLDKGMRASEALYFWLGGFSDDAEYPLSGPGGPSFTDADGDNNLEPSDEQLEGRNRRYEFELTRLVPRDESTQAFTGRYIQYKDPRDNTITRQINFWRYLPNGSEQPFVYFDVSRYKPGQYDVWAADPMEPNVPYIFAFKQLRSGGPATPANISDVVYVNHGKFQILHAGLDDVWGDAFMAMALRDPNGWGDDQNSPAAASGLLLYPTGPFIGEVADTLTNFTDGTVEDAVE